MSTAPASCARLARGASAVVNLVGILNETGGADVRSRRTSISRSSVIAACKAAGVRRLVHMSALNADPAGPSRYLRSKGEAEAAVAASGLDWTIFQPSVIFGREDAFLNLFARLLRIAPVMALAARGREVPAGVRRRRRRVHRARARAAGDDRAARTRSAARRSTRCASSSATSARSTGTPRPIIALGPDARHAAGARARAPAGNADEPRQPRVDGAGQRLRLRLSRGVRRSRRRRSRPSRPPTSGRTPRRAATTTIALRGGR